MKKIYKITRLLLVAMCICFIFDACSSRYSSNGRYRPKKSKGCRCPAYSYNNVTQNNVSFFTLSELPKL